MADGNTLIYFTAFGQEYVDQFKFTHKTLIDYGIDIILITDSGETFEGVTKVNVRSPKSKPEMFAYRMNGYRIIDFSRYDHVWYSDTDIVFKSAELFTKYNNGAIWVCQEPDQNMSNEHFCELLRPHQRQAAMKWPAINSGLFVVPKARINFWNEYRKMTEAAYRKRQWIAEQHALNYMYFKSFNHWAMKLFAPGDIGFPIKNIPGRMADHYICLPNSDKLKWMQSSKR